ncbi:MAG: immunoglobulin domain-containing protein, partial [Verrucomicrobia bacterium]|nr:immunoglobulin domain-containing protein [Verrucomicrobiota bacterium]
VSLSNVVGGWRLDGGVDFAFPSGTTMPAMSYLLVVNFDASNPALVAAFRSRLGVAQGVPIQGPYVGKLDNASERVALELPQAPDLPGEDISWVIVDEVIYADQTPWQLSADGLGPSLQRQNVLVAGNDPGNWQAAVRTPGAAYGGGVAPTITAQPGPASQTSPAGAVISYTVTAQGTAPLSYLWLFNGSALAGTNGSSLTLNNVHPSDSGAYNVVVLNPAGSALSGTVLLSVTIPPAISFHPQPQTVLPGTGVTFTVNASGTGALSYQWRKDGLNIPGANSASHSIPSAQASDDALYTVVVSDANGAVISNAARLTVLIPPTFVLVPVAQSVPLGGTVTFSVETAGTLPMGYHWKVGGRATVAKQFLNSHVSFLTISNVTLGHAGGYQVIVTNEAYLQGLVSPTAALSVLIDSDGDGMDDQWETDHGYNPSNPSDATLDLDEDGLTTRQEYQAGTDPTDEASYLQIESLIRDSEVSGGFLIQFMALASKSYTVQFRDSLVSPWSRLIDVSATTSNRLMEIVDQPPLLVNHRFYRLVTPGIP